jgi:predicted house-cleaning noncanonical NTP pyrophosphatase (MazG superfamily)
MAFKNPTRETEYQKNYHQKYKPKMLQKLKDELKTLSQQHEIEAYIDDFVFIYEDVDESTSTLVQITWYKYLIKFIRHRLKVVH